MDVANRRIFIAARRPNPFYVKVVIVDSVCPAGIP